MIPLVGSVKSVEAWPEAAPEIEPRRPTPEEVQSQINRRRREALGRQMAARKAAHGGGKNKKRKKRRK